MKTRFVTIAAWIILAASARAAETSYNIAPSADSRLELIVEKTGLYSGKKHVFTFERYSGTLLLDVDAMQQTKINLTIETASIACHDTWVSMKDLSKIMEEATKNMLDAARFPTITVQSSGVTPSGPGNYDVQGILTIRGISKPAKVVVNWTPGSAQLIALQGDSIVKLTGYSLKPPTAVLGAIGTKNEMQFHFRLALKPEE